MNNNGMQITANVSGKDITRYAIFHTRIQSQKREPRTLNAL